MRFLTSILNRLREPSTHAGLAITIGGLGQVLDWDEAPQAAAVVQEAGVHLSTGDYVSAAGVGIFGALAIIMSEKGKG